MKDLVFFIICFFVAICMSFGAAHALEPRPKVIVHARAEIDSGRLSLNDIADISGGEETELLVTQLKQISLGRSPALGAQKKFSGREILRAILAKGFREEQFGYAIPREVIVTRKGRYLTKDEVISRAKASLEHLVHLELRDISWKQRYVVPEGNISIVVEPLGSPESGSLPMRVQVAQRGDTIHRFLVTAMVDDWREIPVVNKSLPRGTIITASDIDLIRANLFHQPQDVVLEPNAVIGKRVKSRLRQGTVLRKRAIDIPPIIPSGRKVTMINKDGPFQATASGVAIQDGFKDEQIKIKNEQSRKIVVGLVVDESTVAVGGE